MLCRQYITKNAMQQCSMSTLKRPEKANLVLRNAGLEKPYHYVTVPSISRGNITTETVAYNEKASHFIKLGLTSRHGGLVGADMPGFHLRYAIT
jgi:hypothetical protein